MVTYFDAFPVYSTVGYASLSVLEMEGNLSYSMKYFIILAHQHDQTHDNNFEKTMTLIAIHRTKIKVIEEWNTFLRYFLAIRLPILERMT